MLRAASSFVRCDHPRGASREHGRIRSADRPRPSDTPTARSLARRGSSTCRWYSRGGRRPAAGGHGSCDPVGLQQALVMTTTRNGGGVRRRIPMGKRMGEDDRSYTRASGSGAVALPCSWRRTYTNQHSITRLLHLIPHCIASGQHRAEASNAAAVTAAAVAARGGGGADEREPVGSKLMLIVSRDERLLLRARKATFTL